MISLRTDRTEPDDRNPRGFDDLRIHLRQQDTLREIEAGDPQAVAGGRTDRWLSPTAASGERNQ